MTGGGPALPLKGMSVLVPRGKGQAATFSNVVKGYGGIPIEIPLIAFKPVEAAIELMRSIEQLHTYDWVIFTSNITVETFLSFIDSSQIKKLPKIAAIGKKTEACLLDAGIHVDFIPKEFVAEGFVKEFLPIVEAGMKVFVPKGNLARNVIYTALTEKGAFVDEAIIYETYFPEVSKQKLLEVYSSGTIDILTFTSPSTVDHFIKVMKEMNLYHKLENSIISCIGPITKDKIQSYGLQVHCEPSVYTVDHMIESIIAYVQERKMENR